MILAWKKRYQTCLEMLEQLRVEKSELRDAKLSYNGILDPMAEGVVPVLVGDEENKNRDAFTGSEKEYEVGVLVGVSTDSGDLLGIIKNFSDISVRSDVIVEAVMTSELEFEQTVPMHSNRKVQGKRLWWWILNGVHIPEEERPKNKVKILEREFLGEEVMLLDDLMKEITVMREKFGERFRMQQAGESWKRYFEKSSAEKYVVVKFRLKVSSGFYVRTFVEAISKIVGVPLLVLTLKRSKVHYI